MEVARSDENGSQSPILSRIALDLGSGSSPDHYFRRIKRIHEERTPSMLYSGIERSKLIHYLAL
jgi:hypothetical protein